jgi:hypothetical protein
MAAEDSRSQEKDQNLMSDPANYAKPDESGVKISVGVREEDMTPEVVGGDATRPRDEATYMKYLTDCSGPKSNKMVGYTEDQGTDPV